MSGTSSGRLSVATAEHLLDFRGSGTSPITEHAAREQLRGAVALHNLLADEGFAYLADEVGMGKTYVALGALALFRHFDPGFRVLILAPRENIQKKWLKELRNFAARNVRFADMRVRAVHGTPARATVVCHSLLELVRETAVDPDRDFFARLTSFSLPIGKDADGWAPKRNELRKHLPWIDPALLDLRDRETFKDNFARAINCMLPTFDLVIVDEGHNLKHGFKVGAAARNRALALAFGHPSQRGVAVQGFTGYGRRAKRVLFLSATPLENDYIHLWNQLDVFGFGERARLLADSKAPDDEKRRIAQRFLVRRVTTLPVAGKELTKNLYRREWRGGGIELHDEPLAVPGDLQRLAVALVQKKVSEVLDAPKFNNSFQIGMLASFESFLETAKVKKADSEDGTFDDSEQTDDMDERLGVDVEAVNGLAQSFRRKFGKELPHPKMDAIVQRLAKSFETGEKALVFVRRVASVKELKRKLEERYDAHIFARLRNELAPSLQVELEEIIARYSTERANESQRRRAALESAGDAPDGGPAPDDEGGTESFFAWFFRGEGPDGVLSGATLQRRFSQAGSINSTFFEDNHVALLLGVAPGAVVDALATYLGRTREDVLGAVWRRASARLPQVKKQQRRNLFLACQGAAVAMLAEHPGGLRERALVLFDERYREVERLQSRTHVEDTSAADWLELPTFWTWLRKRPGLRESLWPSLQTEDSREHIRELELRRELLSAMMRLGHPFIDLFVLTVNRIGSLQLRKREVDDEDVGDLASEFLNLLEKQQLSTARHTAYAELAEAAANFDLLLAVNEPEARTAPLESAATLFGRLLRAQQPVAGMAGQVNETVVRQFRMPGYPMVLITTDLLQEGEDLHTFCSAVHHYGISWMPSSMEQRVGRVDRVSSQTDRRLSKWVGDLGGEQLLQVHYPYLADTVDVLQVRRVLHRLDRFLRLMHEDLGTPQEDNQRIDVQAELLNATGHPEPIRDPLRTAFPVREEMLAGPDRPLAVSPDVAIALRTRFRAIPTLSLGARRIAWEDRPTDQALFGTLMLARRQQPFTLLLRSVEGRAVVRCVSPVGVRSLELSDEELRTLVAGSGVRVAAVFDDQIESYNLTIEGDVLLGAKAADAERIAWLLDRVTAVADRLEEEMLDVDEPMETFATDLEREATYER